MKFTTLAITILAANLALAQPTNFNTQRNWSMNKKELMIGLGGTSFLGDLGGANQDGTDYSLKDLDFPSTGFGGSIGYRYRFHPYYATSTILNIGMVRGDDSKTGDLIRNSRNLHFRSPIINLSQRFEIILLANEKIGRRFNIPGLKGFKDHNEQFYIFTGIGITYFNPKAKYNGSWTALRPLNTEGQGLAGGPSEYLPVTATIPFGVGVRMGINRFWRVGLEATYVKTFSDYIDDVHGTYYDPAIIGATNGAEAAYLSNPAAQNAGWFGPGNQRGDKQNDAMIYLNLTVYRNLTYSTVGRGPHIRFGRPKYRAKF
ncbi:MAG: hypothetical protein V4604_01890 [Bacteroidota bacterium]